MSKERRFFSGLTELMILACLLQRPCYCYEIVKYINIYFDDEYKISQNTVYTAIYSLKDKKLIDEQNITVGKKRIRIYYNILPEGKKYFEEYLKEYRANIGTVENVLKNSKKLIG